MTAVVPSGTETISTDCGPLQEAFAELTEAVGSPSCEGQA